MRRFRDVQDFDDPAVAELAGMLRAMGDLDPPLGAEVRIRAALARRGAPQPWWLRAVVVLLLVVAIPAAVAGVNLLIRMPPQTAAPAADRGTSAAARDRAYPATEMSPVAPVSPAPAQDAPSPGVARAVPAPSTPEVDRSPPRRAAPDEPSTRSTPAGRRTELPHGWPASTDVYRDPVTRSTETPVESPVELPRLATRAPDEDRADPRSIRSDEADLVHGAMRALRRDHDPQAAIRQLAAYHRRFPTGDLTEEALALSIEAFVALDDREALALANEYLRRFPDGRFRDLAERAQHRFRGSSETPRAPGSTHPSRTPQTRPVP